MDNNQIDQILKEKLKDKIKPSQELEEKIRHKVEDEKYKKLKTMYDALLDLYCLAACKKIIGSYFSSFTDTAASLGGIEKLIAGIDN